ncbi:MAG: methyltransferase domain-containing protein [Terriglobales bacterium]
MERRAPLTWLENAYLQRYFHGRGIELGALWRRFPLPRRARVWYLDRLSRAELGEHYPELKGRLLRPDLLAEAAELPVRSGSLDFLIASHVLEHMPFPLRALRAWYEALAPGGALLLKIPDKRYTFDARRERTPLQHLIAENDDGQAFDRRAHYADWVANVGNQSADSPGFDDAVQDLMQRDYSIHFHVWIDSDICEIIDFTRREWRLDWEPAVFWGAHFYRKETMVVLVRRS